MIRISNNTLGPRKRRHSQYKFKYRITVYQAHTSLGSHYRLNSFDNIINITRTLLCFTDDQPRCSKCGFAANSFFPTVQAWVLSIHTSKHSVLYSHSLRERAHGQSFVLTLSRWNRPLCAFVTSSRAPCETHLPRSSCGSRRDCFRYPLFTTARRQLGGF